MLTNLFTVKPKSELIGHSPEKRSCYGCSRIWKSRRKVFAGKGTKDEHMQQDAQALSACAPGRAHG
jgi:hypothetical protein